MGAHVHRPGGATPAQYVLSLLAGVRMRIRGTARTRVRSAYRSRVSRLGYLDTDSRAEELRLSQPTIIIGACHRSLPLCLSLSVGLSASWRISAE